MEFEVRLDDVRLFGRHGVFEHETRDGNEFVVNLLVRYESASPPADDSLEGTISYVRLFEITKEEMGNPRRLLETVAASIVRRIKEEFPFALSAECRIAKTVPPIRGFIGEASVCCRTVFS